MLWVFDNNKEEFVEQEVRSLKITNLLIALNMSLGSNDSSRLIKGNSVSIREHGETWTKVTDINLELPKGFPHQIKVGSGALRLVKDPSSDKFLTKCGSVLVMAPEMFLDDDGINKLQSIELWTEMWRQR